MAKAGKGMGNEKTEGHQSGTAPGQPGDTRSDFADQIHGDNEMQGNDQRDVRNQRSTMPGETDKTEGVVESFENMDPKARAGRRP